MPSLKDIRTRISSVKNTQKITKAMKMVAAAKLRKAQDAVTSTRPYVEKLVEVIDHLSERVEHEQHPLLRVPEKPRRAVVLLVSGDRGLCGAYNTNVNRKAHAFIERRTAEFDQLDVWVVGRKGAEFLKHRGVAIARVVEDGWKRPPELVAEDLADDVSAQFAAGEVDAFYVIYTKFFSAIAQTVVLDRVLPLRNVAEEQENKAFLTLVDYIYEPSVDELLEQLLPQAVMVQVQRALLESNASEQGARMTAMDNATNNAGEMIDSLTLQYNRARQAAITRELIEIISGAESI